ncbi:MAG: alanine racemase [Ruminococcaceae bacterium]|nr:alanine racemase [Oscillospiraceae bacterium]
MFKRTRAEIDLSALAHNYIQIKKGLKSDTAVMAIVKADAYGHGAITVARELEAQGVTCFGVSSNDEAVQLRVNGIKIPILVLGYTNPESYNELLEYSITQTVFSYEQAKTISDFCIKKGKTMKIHLKLDTGMGRLGFMCSSDEDIEKTVSEIKKVLELENLEFEGIFTHFAESDKPESDYTQKQFSYFMKAVEKIGYSFKYKHCSNSAAIINFPEMQLDMVRPGIILYGLLPSSKTKNIGLLPVMSLCTRVAQIKSFEKDTSISYSRTYKTTDKTKVAVLPIGYADGFARGLSGKIKVLIKGQPANIIGLVCMDMTMADISKIEDVRNDDNVLIFGKENGNILPVEQISDILGTINYETVCCISKRIPRIYIKDDKVIEEESYIR